MIVAKSLRAVIEARSLLLLVDKAAAEDKTREQEKKSISPCINFKREWIFKFV